MTTGMEYFLVLAEEQSISRVAQHLFVTQQSMSEQMKRLEQLYCAKLFTRRPRFQLTAAGEALLSTARQIRILEQGLTLHSTTSRRKAAASFGRYPCHPGPDPSTPGSGMVLPRFSQCEADFCSRRCP